MPYPAPSCPEIPAPQGGEPRQLLRGRGDLDLPSPERKLAGTLPLRPRDRPEKVCPGEKIGESGGGESRGRSRVERALGATPTHSSPGRPPP